MTTELYLKLWKWQINKKYKQFDKSSFYDAEIIKINIKNFYVQHNKILCKLRISKRIFNTILIGEETVTTS